MQCRSFAEGGIGIAARVASIEVVSGILSEKIVDRV